MIDWQRIALNLRQHYKPLTQVAFEIGCDIGTLERLARGETSETKWSICTNLLDLHFDKCPTLHNLAHVGLPHQQTLELRRQ